MNEIRDQLERLLSDLPDPASRANVILATFHLSLRTTAPIAWAVYGGRTGILRYVLQDEERVFELEEGGYKAIPLYAGRAVEQ